MKRMRIVFFIAAPLILAVFFSCQEPYLPGPLLPSGGVVERWVIAPDGLKASQGEKRSITLSWNQDSNAALYYIYHAENPLNKFVRCGETTSTQFKFNVPPGSTLYYRVSSVSYDGTESAQSVYVRGTSLAQPVISDITDITESAAAVTWYMENVFEDSYKDSLLYTVYCYNGAGEFAQIALDGSVISENRAVFNGLAPNTRYEYQVEAYLRGDQSASEKSDKMDAATARRFRPGAPIDIRASHGAAVDRINVSFELPDMVDIALGENLYDPKPLYFVISKRFYSKSGNNEYQKVCSYFGSIKDKGTLFTGGYVPGATVTWSDTNVTRGVKYEYLVQSYVDDTLKIISSDSSKANAAGWALSEGNLSFGKVEYTMGNGLYASAALPLDFEFDPQDESYDYVLKEEIEPLEDGDPYDPSGIINREIPFNTYEAVRAYTPSMDLTQKTTAANPGRGIYSFAVEIKLKNGVLLDTVSTIGKKEVSENTDPIIVDNFRIQDGYTDKFVLKWDYYSNRKYTLYIVDNKGTVVKEIGSVNENPTAQANADYSYSYTYKADDIIPGVTRYFAIRPFRYLDDGSFKQGQMVYAGVASRTLGVPIVSLGGDSSYSAITAAWTEAQKADTYRVKYRYTGETAYKTAATINKDALDVDAYGKYKYTFRPEGYEIDIAKAGKEIQIQVDALNEGLRSAGGGEISTSSTEDVRTRLVGPSELGLLSGRADSATEIDVSWNKVSGADGYYVFRRKFNMNNTAEEGTEAVVYYVPAAVTSLINVTGKNLALDTTNAKIDTTTVKAAATFAGSRYTLKDIYMPDNDYDGGAYSRHTDAYRNQQNDMIQGYPYRYWVVPVINGTSISSIEFVYNKDSVNKNTDIAYYAIQENGTVKYSGAASVEKTAGTGFTIGFGQDVTASKGTYSSSGNVNDGIKVTWSPPPLLATVPGFSPRYTVYRRYSISDGIWSAWETAGEISASQHIDVLTPGTTYEYMVGITNGSGAGGSDPRVTTRFLNESYSRLDEKGRPKMIGFMLDKVRLANVSRDQRSDGQGSFGEEVSWTRDGFNVDGYTVYLLNRNINNNRQWIECDSVSGSSLSVLIANTGNRLKVLREYRHYFKVRSYMINDEGNKIFGPDPMPNYTWTTDPEPYVKWGARQVSADEFAAITSLSIGTGMNWAGNLTSDVPDRRGDHNVTFGESDIGYNRDINFSNSKPYFVTVSGHLYGQSGATLKTPRAYGAEVAKVLGVGVGDAADPVAKESTLTITGPSDANGMYSGTVIIRLMRDNSGAGPYKINYNGQNGYNVEAKHYRECFTFGANSKEYKRTRNFDWSPSTGIAGTGTIGPNMADKWWYTGDRAGWD